VDGLDLVIEALDHVIPVFTDRLAGINTRFCWPLASWLSSLAQDDVVAKGSVTLICSESGTGKTWLAYYLAGCVAHGRAFLGRAVNASRVLYLDGENPLYTVKQRLFDLGIDETPNLTVWGGWARPSRKISLLICSMLAASRSSAPIIVSSRPLSSWSIAARRKALGLA
jgi:hypothetical protein